MSFLPLRLPLPPFTLHISRRRGKIKEMKTITLSFSFFLFSFPQNSRKACHSAGNDTRFGELSLMRTRAKIIDDRTGNSARALCLIDGVDISFFVYSIYCYCYLYIFFNQLFIAYIFYCICFIWYCFYCWFMIYYYYYFVFCGIILAFFEGYKRHLLVVCRKINYAALFWFIVAVFDM